MGEIGGGDRADIAAYRETQMNRQGKRLLNDLDQEIHCGLLRYCLEAGQELDSWLRAERAEAPSSETVIGEVPQGFKNRRDWQAFRQRMRKFFGADREK